MSKNNRVNHDFQIAYFIAGACHTPDAAWSALCDLKEDRELALFASQEALVRFTGVETVEAKVFNRNYVAAQKELAFIEECMKRLEPHRKYAHLPADEAHEACQQEEWKLELIHRAENHMLTSGTIPADHFATMRMHPEFKEAIVPCIKELQIAITALQHSQTYLDKIGGKKALLPLLLENKI